MTTLATEEPFSASVESALLQNVCHACFNYSDRGKLKRCSRCSVVHYCSVKCQQRDWQDHSVECKCLRNYSPRIPNSFVRLIARFLFKSLSQGESFVAFNSRRCVDLQDNCEKLVSSQRHTEHFSSLFNILLKYAHGVNLAASRAELFSAYGKIVTNAFAITNAGGRVLGTGLYIGISVHDHSCVPDAFVYFEGSTAVMRSLQVGTSYDRSLTISYVDLIHTTDERNKIFRDQFCFTCTCPSCSDSAEDQWKMSVNTTCCAGGFCTVDPSSDWNAEPPTCVLCKNEVVLKLGEVLDYNVRAKLELEAGTRTHFQSPDEEFNHWLAVYEKFAKVLSPYNTTLVAITQNLLLAAESIGRTDILQKCTGSTLSAYKRYLPLGHPELTQRLRSASMSGAGVSCEDVRNRLEEIYTYVNRIRTINSVNITTFWTSARRNDCVIATTLRHFRVTFKIYTYVNRIRTINSVNITTFWTSARRNDCVIATTLRHFRVTFKDYSELFRYNELWEDCAMHLFKAL